MYICLASIDSLLFCRYSDYPHGRFGIESAYQTVVVMPTDLKRAVRLNITRSGGTVGRVRVSFGLVYNQVSVILEVTTRGWITEDICG